MESPANHACILSYHPSCIYVYCLAVYGNEKTACVKNKSHSEIHERFMMLRNSSGVHRHKFRQQVISDSPAVRPIWSPFHNQFENPLSDHVTREAHRLKGDGELKNK
jgi:large subunit ribosomal protein L43